MATWLAGGGQDAVTTLMSDMQNVGNDGSDVAALATDCAQMAVDVSNVKNVGPVPDPTVQEHWAKALDYYGAAASECVAGAQNQDAASIQQATADIEQANAEMTIVNTALGATG
jgi:hypothetical protein